MPSLYWNYANAAAYGLNLLVTFGIGVFGWFGLPTNSELSAKYSTLITPAGWTFSIWSIIFIAQAVFCFVQLQRKYEVHPLVNCVEYYYVAVCGLQVLWTIFFANEVMWMAFLLMLGILYYLVKIERQQYELENPAQGDVNESTVSENNEAIAAAANAAVNANAPVDIKATLTEYMLLRFPFSLHCGWILVASFLNLSVCLVKYGNGGHQGQQYLAAISLMTILLLAMVYMLQSELTIPLVVSWAAFGIYAELGDPNDLILSTFHMEFIDFFKCCAIIIAIVALFGTLAHAYFWYKSGGISPSYGCGADADADAADADYVKHEDEGDGVMKETA